MRTTLSLPQRSNLARCLFGAQKFQPRQEPGLLVNDALASTRSVGIQKQITDGREVRDLRKRYPRPFFGNDNQSAFHKPLGSETNPAGQVDFCH
jgi:hypothetical protein